MRGAPYSTEPPTICVPEAELTLPKWPAPSTASPTRRAVCPLVWESCCNVGRDHQVP